ncbi:alpha/beta fold hydrolase [Pedobacter sp. BMA]|uniref:alpha/beta fold hydrolase n=1 Tax=Pedobacter sp. BMA TaxID=1663685 RepID=UPI00064A237F|nr:alpha/beta hydrolase [Pedobacter sp. BMA]KLT65632.1 hypothetical protein AB669_11230 [Pedobacter sp. BMA]
MTTQHEHNTKNTSATTDRPALVFLHYFGGAAITWKWLIENLGGKFNCVALDLPGFGNTPPLPQPSIQGYSDYITGALRQLRLESYILIGHSMGGKLALQCAVDDRDIGKVKQVILVAPSPPGVEKMPEAQQKEMRLAPDEPSAKKSVRDSINIELSDAKLETAILTTQQVHPETRKWWIDKGIHHSIAEYTKTLSVPVSLIVSHSDPAITDAMTRAETIPNLPATTEIIFTDRSGHLIPLEDTVWLAETILKEICY